MSVWADEQGLTEAALEEASTNGLQALDSLQTSGVPFGARTVAEQTS